MTEKLPRELEALTGEIQSLRRSLTGAIETVKRISAELRREGILPEIRMTANGLEKKQVSSPRDFGLVGMR